MTVQCINCSKFSLQDAGKEFAQLGFGQCSERRGGAYHSARYSRECSIFDRAADLVIEKRLKWMDRPCADTGD
jgi:hypothetical protein